MDGYTIKVLKMLIQTFVYTLIIQQYSKAVLPLFKIVLNPSSTVLFRMAVHLPEC
jgi:hypothetical protein